LNVHSAGQRQWAIWASPSLPKKAKPFTEAKAKTHQDNSSIDVLRHPRNPFEQFTYAPGAKKATQLRPVSVARMLAAATPVRPFPALKKNSSPKWMGPGRSSLRGNRPQWTNSSARSGAATSPSITNEKIFKNGRNWGRRRWGLLRPIGPDPQPESESKVCFSRFPLDCKGVSLVQRRPLPRSLAFENGKKGINPWHSVVWRPFFASVYTVDRHVRTAGKKYTAALFRGRVREGRRKGFKEKRVKRPSGRKIKIRTPFPEGARRQRRLGVTWPIKRDH